MTRLSRNSSHPERSFSPPKVLHSTSGNAHFSGTESLSSSGQADSNPLTASLYHPHPTSSHGPYVPFEVRDRRGHLHCGWKKITSINGCTSRQHQTTTEADEYLDRQIIEDAQGRKHAIWVRIDGMLTHAEIYSPKYIAYRARQQKVVDKNGEQVWSDELEEAFQFALRKIPPMGKNQTPSGEANGKKSYGRNELISKLIFKLTGVTRYRKQVSSHIQVLKGLMNKGSSWLKLVTYDKKANAENGPSYSYFDAIKGEMVFGPPKNRSRHGNMKTEEEVFNRLLPPPVNTLGSSNLPRNPSVQRVRFDMCVHAAISGDIIHTYTTSQSEMGAQSRNLEDVLDWRSVYPDLEKLYHEHTQLNSEIFLLETNFKLMDDLPPRGSRLGIHLFADVDSKQGYTNWKHSTTFYVHGKPKRRPSGPLRPILVENASRTQLEIPLESSWWIDVFHQIIDRRYKKIATGNAKDVLQEEEDARRYLRELSVMQEIYATSPHELEPQRIAIFLWKFRQTRGDEVAMTTWRRLIPPPPTISIHSPPPSPKQPSLGIYQTQLGTHNIVATQPSVHAQRTRPLECGDWTQSQPNLLNKSSQDVMSKAEEDYDCHFGQSHLNALTKLPAFSKNRVQYRQESYLDPDLAAPVASMTNQEFSTNAETYSIYGSSVPNLDNGRSHSSRHGTQPYPQYTLQEQVTSSRSNASVDLSTLDYSTEGFGTQSTVFSYNAVDYQDGNFLGPDEMMKPASELGQSTAHYTSTDMESHATSRCTPDPYGGDFTGGQIHLNIDPGSDLALYDPAILNSSAELSSQHQHRSCIPQEPDPEYLCNLVTDVRNQQDPQPLERYMSHEGYSDHDQRHHHHHLEQNPHHSLVPQQLDTYLLREPSLNLHHHHNLPPDVHPQHPSRPHDHNLSPPYDADTHWHTQLLPDPFPDLSSEHPHFKHLNVAVHMAESSALQTWDIIDLPVAGIGECDGGDSGGLRLAVPEQGLEGEQGVEVRGKILGEVGLDVEMGEEEYLGGSKE